MWYLYCSYNCCQCCVSSSLQQADTLDHSIRTENALLDESHAEFEQPFEDRVCFGICLKHQWAQKNSDRKHSYERPQTLCHVAERVRATVNIAWLILLTDFPLRQAVLISCTFLFNGWVACVCLLLARFLVIVTFDVFRYTICVWTGTDETFDGRNWKFKKEIKFVSICKRTVLSDRYRSGALIAVGIAYAARNSLLPQRAQAFGLPWVLTNSSMFFWT